MTHTTLITAGVDTSKAKLDVAVHGKDAILTVENSPSGWKRLAGELGKAGVQRIGIEATGGYERGVTRYLQSKHFIVVVLQPMQVKAFGMLNLKRAKTDRIDARLIAACTHILDANNRMPPDPRFDALTGHLTFIEQLDDDIVLYKTRLEHTAEPRLRRFVTAEIKRREKRRADELKRLAAALREHADLARRLELVQTVPGIGERTAIAIVVRLPELGQLSREQVAALAGLAPFAQQSGKRQGETHIGGGRSRLRRSLYAAALPAALHWNPALKAFYKRLTARNMSHTSALVACARKLLIFANTVVHRGTAWLDRTAAA